MKTKSQTVFVGLSGGVDSSVAALRLKKAGFNVVGVFIKVWHPDWLKCNWEQERLDAMRVAAKLDIPFLTCDAEKAYKDDVADYFISEYEAGRTPNPDVMCNKYVKFGAFLRFAKEHGADYVATGHYSRKEDVKMENEEVFHHLLRGVDQNKDQSYFLWTLTQDQLSKILFPVGDTPKPQIRKEAEKAGLVTAEKKDSQGVCFLGHIDIAEFIGHYVDLEEGAVLDTAGNEIGRHQGALIYTTGQRHGFIINSKENARGAHYVMSRDLENNTITVATEPPTLSTTDTIELKSLNLITNQPLPAEVEIQTRYRQKPTVAKVLQQNDEVILLQPTEEIDSVSIGQSCVIYQADRCLGGGIIS